MDRPRLDRTLGAPALTRLVARIARRIEFGRPLTGKLTLTALREHERRALDELFGTRHRGTSASVSLDELDQILRVAGIATDLESAVQALAGPITPRAGVHAAEEESRAQALSTLAGCVHATEPWFAEWTAQLRSGPLTRILRAESTDVIAQAVAVLDRLPARDLPLSVLAERATGNTKALVPEEPLSRLVLRALALRTGAQPAAGQTARREVWASAGVIVDDLASQVLVLNLRAEHGMVSGWLNDAASEGIPFRLTLQQLRLHPLVPAVPEVYVCENPAVLRAAAAGLQRDCAPLVCTEGVPSAACHALLTAAATAGARIRWRADFDWAGVRITGAGLARYSAHPWRMHAQNYIEALQEGASEPLRGSPTTSPWDPDLAVRLAEAGRAVMEERLIPHLITDLAAPGSAAAAREATSAITPGLLGR